METNAVVDLIQKFFHGHADNVTLDLVCYNFGVQEYSAFNARTQEAFQACPGDEERLPLRE